MVDKFFKEMPPSRREQLERYCHLLREKNRVLNLISRRQEDKIFSHHILPSLAVGVQLPFPAGGNALDVGTGGGLPGIPLAIAFPECHFTLLDSIGKKIRAVDEFVADLGLGNVDTHWGRVEGLPPTQKFNVIIGRAVAALPQFLPWTWPRIKDPGPDVDGGVTHGVLYLSGGTIPSGWKDSEFPEPQIFPLTEIFENLHEADKWIAYFEKRL
ncbi:MAG: 16S rRNA (guanine(527)-N(7))-methyltransferase RsmG [Puniceicoccales bacterium]|jgi:16S rRNA (guanine527-N7)-methyltransferase|nr:16S rRNA (guanine(527)-N(7))-methyltransferase RsmG [Puniceicoccales bacterium]